MKKKLAIVGSGISALSCAHYLRDDYDISIFDKNDYLGGHTHTHNLEEAGREFTIDTGFIVFNKETYPNMLKLFAELGVKKQKTDMSFSVYNKKSNLQFAGTNIATVFAQKKNIFSLRYIKFIREILHFFKIANRDYIEVIGSQKTIEDYCKENNLSSFFIENYLAPMSSAVWSTPQKDVRAFPIALLLPFFHNHGLLSASGQFQWYTVAGGSNAYIKKIIKNGNFDIHLSEAVLEVEEIEGAVKLKTIKAEYDFDFVILASHADDSLRIAKHISEHKKNILSKYTYNKNLAVLHSDENVMPTVKETWSAWNQVIASGGESATVYWMNKLQKPKTSTNFFVSINPVEEIAETKILKQIIYYHPNFTTENFALQSRLQDLNKNTKIFFAGSYFGYGFHEDGLKSGLEVVKILKK